MNGHDQRSEEVALPATVVLAGNPNAGKTTLFNQLTGLRAQTGNYPGVTVERRSGHLRLPSGRPVELIDLPGTYSLTARSADEQVAVEVLLPSRGAPPAATVIVCDTGALSRHLYLAAQIIAFGRPAVVALNMMDEAERAGLEIDVRALSEGLGVPVVPIVASQQRGVRALLAALEGALSKHTSNAGDEARPEALPDPLGRDVERIEAALTKTHPGDTKAARRARAILCLLSLGDDRLHAVPPALRERVAEVRADAEADGRNVDREVITARYARIDALVASAVRKATARPTPRSFTERADAVLTHPVAGLAIFALVMFLLFEALFTGAEPAIAAVEYAVGAAQSLVKAGLPEGPLRALLADGILAGVGNVLVFVPQIALLFLFIAFLEDSGYLARVAFVIDRVMRSVGLHGRAFVPLLSGFACAVPAILSTRTIENRRDRLITMMALPLMSCSARLPVYALVTAVVFPGHARFFGFLSVGALVLFCMYTLSVVATLSAATLLRNTVLRGPRPTLILELPPYRRPGVHNLARAVSRQVRSFLKDAGTLILAVTIVLWGLLHFPSDPTIHARYEQAQARATEQEAGPALDRILTALREQEAAEAMAYSAAGRLGHAVEPLLAPLGFDWRIGIGLIGSFAAREVLVSTLGLVWGQENGAKDAGLRDALGRARRPNGRPLFTPMMGLSLMVFFVLAAQCMSTLATIRKETRSWRWPLFALVYMNTLAYALALLTYQTGLLLGYT